MHGRDPGDAIVSLVWLVFFLTAVSYSNATPSEYYGYSRLSSVCDRGSCLVWLISSSVGYDSIPLATKAMMR